MIRSSSAAPVGVLRSCLANERQHRLLTLCLATSPQTAEAAWRDWIAAVDIENLDVGSSRLLPLAYLRLTALGVRHPAMLRLGGVLRHSWANNLTQRHRVGSVLRAFDERGIRHLLLKGAPLAFAIYPNPGARPMDDVDVLVPFERAQDAMDFLLSLGAKRDEAPLPPRRPGGDDIDPMLLKHGFGFTMPDGLRIDLHWFALQDCCRPGIDAGFWERRRHLPGIPGAWHPSAEDNFLHLCVHGLRASPIPSIRWIADAVTLLRVSSEHFDWELLRAEARRRRLIVPLRHALDYLRQNFEAPVPDSVVAAFAKEPAGLLERAAHHGNISSNFITQFAATWVRYSRTVSHRGWPGRCLGFPSYLSQCWGRIGYVEVAKHIVRRSLRRGQA